MAVNSEYAKEIDLGRKETALDVPMPAAPRGTKGKSRTFYPTLYIDAVPGLEDLPKEGCVMVKYRRTRMNIETPEDGDEKAGVTLEIRKICLPEEMDEEGEKNLASVMDGKMAEEESDDESDDEDEEE